MVNMPDMKRMAEVVMKVYALVVILQTEKPGYNTPENVIEHHMYDAFTKVKGRLIVSCYASNFIRIQQVLNS